ncbi:hypothetical protein GOQ29_06900 [Clostridium sp. D2Q-14]|uniref:hypothetical protein n=1 Tax=Anaeromonas gelatinilytica TaxID=2683194 RepID=UPI00193B6860|nr:hypothetical protein [Anaeromonas gelatinilytica]MBS4535344.1 hypothetical protein [Anaeromonas gelatinilytica]
MKNKSWYEDINLKISNLIDKLGSSNVRKYRVELLDRLSKRTEEFSIINCNECKKHKQLIEGMIQYLEGNNEMKRKMYLNSFNKLIGHMNSKHDLHVEGTKQALWMSMGMSLGSGLGIIFGIVYDNFENIAVGLPIGTGFGMFIGILIGQQQEVKLKEEGKII